MVDYMSVKEFFREDKGVIAAEYIIFVAAVGILMAVGVGIMFTAMGNFFGSWAAYFGG